MSSDPVTGRLKTEPNLQNIPLRTELGQEVRKQFHKQQEQHMGCGWTGCEGVNFGPVPYSSYWNALQPLNKEKQVDYELRIRTHDKVQGHEERRLVWKDPP